MKLTRLSPDSTMLLDFFQEGLEYLGAICERTWHDRLQIVAEGAAARLWNEDGALHEAGLHFVAAADTAPRDAASHKKIVDAITKELAPPKPAKKRSVPCVASSKR